VPEVLLGLRRALPALAVLVAVAIATVACSSGENTADRATTSSAHTTTTTGERAIDRVEVTRAVEYGLARVRTPKPGLAPLLLDVYQPAVEPAVLRPVVVLVHGGGFTTQSRTDAGIVRIARALAARGMVALSIDYRLLGQGPVPSSRVQPIVDALPKGPVFAAMAAAVDDTLTALDYVRVHAAELGIDEHRIGLIGSSAGAITADHVAYALDDHHVARPTITFVASLWGGMFVAPPKHESGLAADQLGPRDAALFAVHGDADDRVPVELDDQLVARAKAEHVAVEYYRVPGGGHGYDESQFFTRKVAGTQTAFDRLIAFALSFGRS
jgi:acetyl esterase/lipase